MALSFEESKRKLSEQSVAAEVPMMMSMRSADAGIMTLSNDFEEIAAYSGETWTRDTDNYRWFDNYYDDKISYIDEKKNITIDPSQINISQETNSQFIPFEMMQKYDGIDLSTMAITIHYTRSDGEHLSSIPVNVEYNNEKIRFVWLVDGNATIVPGKLIFEVHADGAIIDNKGNEYPYRWKTNSTDKFNITKSVCVDTNCNDVIHADDDWVEDIVTAVANKVADKIADAELSGYATKEDVETAINNIPTPNVSGQIGEHNTSANAHSDIRERIDNIKIPTKVSEFENDSGYLTAVPGEYVTETELSQKGYITEIPDEYVTDTELSAKGYLTEHQSLEGLATETYVSQKLGNLVDGEGQQLTVEAYVKQEVEAVDVSEQLGDTGTDEEGKPKTVVQYVNEKIGELGQDDSGEPIATVVGYVGEQIKKVDVSKQLENYATLSSLNEVKTSLDVVSGNTVTNAENIATVQNNISAIQSSLNSLEGDNKNLIVQYNEVGSVLYLYEKDENGDITIDDGENQITVKEISSTIITGAGGGDALVSTIKLGVTPNGKNSFTVLYGDDVYLYYNLSTRKAKVTQDEDGKDITVYEETIIPGDITLTLYKDNVYVTHFTVRKTSPDVQSGSFDISDYVSLGNQGFTIKASYIEQLGSNGESVTVRSNPSADWSINTVNLKIENLPDQTWESTIKYGSTTFSYTPIGALEKTIYFQIDDKDPETVVTSLNGTALTYTIPQQTHGVHTLQVWCAAFVGEAWIPTDPHKYVLMFAEDGNNTPIIRIKAPETLEQYSSGNIYYNVFDPSNAIIKSVTVYDEDGTILSSKENITSAEQKLEFRPSVVKNKIITVKYNEITESVTIEITKFPYEINAVTGDLMIDFVPTGRTNSDVDYDVFKNNAYTIERNSDTGEEVQKEIPITWSFSDNFDWINGGWKTDENEDAYFCVKAGTYVDINYNLFGTDGVIAKKDANGEYTIAGTGKEFKLIFKTTNVAQANATWLECVDTADKKSLGIRMEAQNAYIDSGLGTLEIPYVDNDVIEFDMNIIPVTKFLDGGEPNLKTKAIPMIMTYEDGTPVQPKVISSVSTSFKQDSPKPITIGSDYCDVHIYRMKVYERYLEDKEIITNFIADARSGVTMAERYVRNDIYPIENKQKITPESVAAACPDLKVYVISAPYFTNDKGNKVSNTTIKQIHNTGTKEKPEYNASENWTATGATHNGQGTSSNEYGYSGRNLEFNLKKATITLNDNVTVVKEIQLSPTSYPTNYLNFKINIASSENANNALLQKRYDRYLPYTSIASLIDDRKKNSMEFFNCVVFIQETDTNIATHREFSDTDVHFYGIGNIGDSKKTDSTRVNDPDDENEFCVEIMDWNRYLSSFPADTMINAMGYTIDEDTGEKVYTWAKDENLGILFELIDGKYVLTSDTSVDLTKTYYVDILEHDDFSEDYTYGFRYVQNEWKKEDYPNYKELNEAFQRPLRQKWIEFYRFVTRDLTTNGVEDSKKVDAWKSEFSNWFITDAAWYYYLYTLRYTMVDNRAKNTFWHWGKHYLTFEEAQARGISVYDDEKNLITDASNLPSKFYDVNGNEIKNINTAAAAINDGYRMDFWDYDNDTALGIDNAGKLEIPIGVEENDADHAGVPYFRAHDSLVFARIAKYFTKELEDMWHTTEINPVGKAFDSITFIDEFDAWQNEFPEELWRLDYERKYKRTYVGGTGKDWDNALPQSNKSDIVSTRFLTEMMNGRKKYQRRCFERNQEIYMSSKFKGEVNMNDTITLRGTGIPTDKIVPYNSTLNIIPFSKMYINLYDDTSHIYYHKKHEAGVPTGLIEYPVEKLDFIYVRGASQIQSFGDLSPMYLQTAELTPGAKLKTVKLGNETVGYSNDSLQTLQIGAGNKLLEELDIRNLSNFQDAKLPVTNIPSLKRVYAQGSNISEASFANNGLLEEAYLPETITRLELRNLHYLKIISLESYENLLHLVVMNCSDAMNNLVLDMINQAPDLKTLRVTNIDWELSDATVLERLYKLIKTSDYPEVVLSGKVHVQSIYEQPLYNYQKAWPDLEITYDNFTPQFIVTFVNDDEHKTELDKQYVVQNQKPEDPITRENNPILTPTKESTPSTRYEFAGWDTDLTKPVRQHLTIKATYDEFVREYTVKYVSNGVVLQESVAPYGSIVTYKGETPTNTSGETDHSDTYRLFSHWDQIGYVDGDKIINAVYDTCVCVGDYFADKKFSELRPVEIYAMTKMQEAGLLDMTDYVKAYNTIDISLGNDFSYNDDDYVVIDKETHFTGKSSVVDTNIQLLSEDMDFVLAIDCKIDSSNSANAVFAQCYSRADSSGFMLQYNNGVKLTWGDSSVTLFTTSSREMIVLRHIKGDNGLYVYSSNTASDTQKYVRLEGIHSMVHDGSLIFGYGRNGTVDTYGTGVVYWSKLWYGDLGDDVCSNIACWPHEDMQFQVCYAYVKDQPEQLYRYDLSNQNASEDARSSLTLISASTLGQPMKMDNASVNEGGWDSYDLNTYLNNRVYAAFPNMWRQLIKQVKVYSTIGNKSSTPSFSNCYIFIPSISEIHESYNKDPYDKEGTLISHFSGNSSRICNSPDGTAVSYWTRSPNVDQPYGVISIYDTGKEYAFNYPYNSHHVRIMFSV